MFEFQVDEVARIIRVTTAGFWTAQEARDFVARYRDHERIARPRWGSVRYLVDASESPVQSADVLKEMNGLHRFVEPNPNDRVAIVVGSSLTKMQTKRALHDELPENSNVTKVFISQGAAEIWLSA